MLLKTFKFYGTETKYTEFETFSGEDTLKVRSSHRTIALTEHQLKMLASRMPDIDSAEYTCITKPGDKAHTMSEFTLAEKYLTDAFNFLFDNLDNNDWMKDHVELTEDGNLQVAKYYFEGHYYGELIHLDLTVMFAKADKKAETVLFNGLEDTDETVLRDEAADIEEVNRFLEMLKKGK